MKQSVRIMFISALLVCSAGVYAQKNSSRLRLSAGVEAGLPTGNFESTAKSYFGSSVQADVSVIKQTLYISANAGSINIYTKQPLRGDIQMIPVKAGLKYFPVKNLYIQGLAGVSFVVNKSKIGLDKSATFVYSPQVGFVKRFGSIHYLDLGLRYESYSKLYSIGNRIQYLGLRVAYAIDIR